MFANVVPPPITRAPLASLTHEARAWLVLKVPSPADAPRGEQVHYGGYILGYADVFVVIEAEVVAPYGGDVVGL